MGIVIQQMEVLEQRQLAYAFPGKVFGRVLCGNQRISVGTPGCVVHPVQDSHQAIRARANDAFQAEAKLRGLNFLCVFLADRRQIVGVDQAALQEINIAEELDAAGMEYTRRNSSSLYSVLGKNAGIADIV